MSVLKVKAKFLDDAESALSSAAFSRSAFSRSMRAVILSIIWPLKLGPCPLSVDMNLAVLLLTITHLAWSAAGREGARKPRARHLEARLVRCDMLAWNMRVPIELNEARDRRTRGL